MVHARCTLLLHLVLFFADMWVLCLRMDCNHRDQNTTSIAEGWHSSTKAWIRSQGSENLRLDHLIHYLLDWVGGLNRYRDSRRFCGV
jgi:hypothetical protein